MTCERQDEGEGEQVSSHVHHPSTHSRKTHKDTYILLPPITYTVSYERTALRTGTEHRTEETSRGASVLCEGSDDSRTFADLVRILLATSGLNNIYTTCYMHKIKHGLEERFYEFLPVR